MRLRISLVLASFLCFFPPAFAADKPSETPLIMVVMDPLAAPLSCPCVQGYAQRDYAKLAKFLEDKLGRPVQVHFSESLAVALEKKTKGLADVLIGKDSVVRNQAKANQRGVVHLASLTDKQGKTTQTGLIVVASMDPALTAGDLKGYRILFGPADCDEKHAAATTLLKELGVTLPGKLETCTSCSEGAVKCIDGFKAQEKLATVISSYAQPLLEGCGTIKKGDLRVVGETDPVPFISAYASDKLTEAERKAIQTALLEVIKHPALCTALETKNGFVLPADASPAAPRSTAPNEKKNGPLNRSAGPTGAALDARAVFLFCQTRCPRKYTSSGNRHSSIVDWEASRRPMTM